MKNAIATRKPAPSPEPSHKVEVRTSEFGNAYVRVTFDGSDEILSTAASHMLVSLYLRAYKAAGLPNGKLCMPSVDQQRGHHRDGPRHPGRGDHARRLHRPDLRQPDPVARALTKEDPMTATRTHTHAKRARADERLQVAIGSNGSRLVAWGHGQTEEEARAEARVWNLNPGSLAVVPASKGAAKLLRDGVIDLEGDKLQIIWRDNTALTHGVFDLGRAVEIVCR